MKRLFGAVAVIALSLTIAPSAMASAAAPTTSASVSEEVAGQPQVDYFHYHVGTFELAAACILAGEAGLAAGTWRGYYCANTSDGVGLFVRYVGPVQGLGKR